MLSNDKLYGSDTEFIAVLEKYATNICQELLIVLKALGDSKETKKQYNLALELFWRVVRRGDLKARPMLSLAANLWMLSQKIQDSNNKFAVSIFIFYISFIRLYPFIFIGGFILFMKSSFGCLKWPISSKCFKEKGLDFVLIVYS